jgi:hypothetical protein
LVMRRVPLGSLAAKTQTAVAEPGVPDRRKAVAGSCAPPAARPVRVAPTRLMSDALEAAAEPVGKASGSPGAEVGTKTGEMDTFVTPTPLHVVQSATGTEVSAASAAATLVAVRAPCTGRSRQCG